MSHVLLASSLQMLSSIWFAGMSEFRRHGQARQAIEVASIALLFPMLSLSIVLMPDSSIGRHARRPFVRFITNSASYLFFLSEFLARALSHLFCVSLCVCVCVYVALCTHRQSLCVCVPLLPFAISCFSLSVRLCE